MNTFLHLLTGTSRGGCESNAICLIRETPQYHHELLVLRPEGEMSAEFGAAGAVVEHRLPGRRSHGLIAAVSETVARVKPTGVLVWHGMVGLLESRRRTFFGSADDSGLPGGDRSSARRKSLTNA